MIEVKNIKDRDWDALICNTEFPSAFLTSWWLRCAEEIFKKKLLLIRIIGKNFDCLVPIYISPDNKSFSVGLVGYGGPNYLCGGSYNLDFVINAIQLHTKIKNFTLISYPQNAKICSSYNITEHITRLLDLSNMQDKLFYELYSGKVRTAIRRAEKSGVKVIRAEINDITTIHEIINQTQDNVNSQYRTPIEFLQKFFNNNDYARIYKASLNDTIIGVSVAILSKFEMNYYLNGWNRSYSSFYPNQALIHNMIQDAMSCKIRFFNFGVSHYELLDKSKSQWGGIKYKIHKISNIRNVK